MKLKNKKLVVKMCERLEEDLRRSVHLRGCKNWTVCPRNCHCLQGVRKSRKLYFGTAMLWQIADNIGSYCINEHSTKKELSDALIAIYGITSNFEVVLGLHRRGNQRVFKIVEHTKYYLSDLIHIIESECEFFIDLVNDALRIKGSCI